MRHGPGKFEGCGNYALVAQFVSAHPDEEIGDVSDFGWFGKFSGKIKGHGPFFAIINEDSQGFVDVNWFTSEDELSTAWLEIETEYEQFDAAQS